MTLGRALSPQRPSGVPLTVAEALCVGLPVFVACTACGAPSRAVSLDGLDPAMELETAAQAGRFKCRSCKKGRGRIMPTLHVLIGDRHRLRFRCLACNIDQAFSAVAACTVFGLATPFDHLRRRFRCGEDCKLNTGAMDSTTTMDAAGRAILALPPASWSP